jgi:hypothetical protein
VITSDGIVATQGFLEFLKFPIRKSFKYFNYEKTVATVATMPRDNYIYI